LDIEIIKLIFNIYDEKTKHGMDLSYMINLSDWIIIVGFSYRNRFLFWTSWIGRSL